MKKITVAVFMIFCLCLVSCNKGSRADLKIYVIGRTMLSASMSEDEIVKLASDDGRLAFDGDDIEGYNWQTHTVTLKEMSVPSVGSVTAQNGGSAVFKTDDTYAFVLVINGKLIYYGGFKSGSKNPYVPLQPSIEDSGRYSFCITFDPKYSSSDDCRSSGALYNFLSANGLLVS